MAKTQEKKKEKKEREKEEKEEEEMEMQAHGLLASHRGWEASTMVVRVKKKLSEDVPNFAWECS